MQRAQQAKPRSGAGGPARPAAIRSPAVRASRAPVGRSSPCACGGGCPRCASAGATPLPEFPHRRAIARAFGLADFAAPALLDPSVRGLGADAATQGGEVRFARPPGLEMAAHEAAHVMQGRGGGRRTDRGGAERHAAAVAGRVRRGFGATDLVGPGLVSDGTPGPHLFIPAGSAPMTHTVVAGDTLWAIARRYYGEGRYADAIRLANPGTVTLNAAGDPVIHPGDVLALPDRADPADPWVNPEIAPLLRTGGAWTRPQAAATLQAFAGESVAHRDAMVARYLGFNNIVRMLAALPVNSTQAGGAFEDQARDLLQRIQRVGAQADARAQGLVDEAAMAQAQATEMTARNRAAAAAALPVGSPPPTPAQIAAQQASQVAAASIPPQTATMSAAQETAINTALNTVSIPAFVAWVAAHHPTLGITAAHLRADARAIFDRGIGIIAFADGTSLRAVVGDEFKRMVAADPAYALPTVVHEIWGHNTYEGRGNYGSSGAAYGLDLYDLAAARMPGYVAPAAGSTDRLSEIDNYGYQETEMYSLMREVPYYTPNAAAHAAITSNYDPAPAIRDRLQNIKDGYEARVARALARGLHLRFVADPTIRPAALNAFRAAVRSVFTVAADAAAILA